MAENTVLFRCGDIVPNARARFMERIGTIDTLRNNPYASWEDRVEATLYLFNTWSLILDTLEGRIAVYGQSPEKSIKENLAFIKRFSHTLEDIKGIIYLHDSSIYHLLYEKKPSKTCLQKAIHTIYSYL